MHLRRTHKIKTNSVYISRSKDLYPQEFGCVTDWWVNSLSIFDTSIKLNQDQFEWNSFSIAVWCGLDVCSVWYLACVIRLLLYGFCSICSLIIETILTMQRCNRTETWSVCRSVLERQFALSTQSVCIAYASYMHTHIHARYPCYPYFSSMLCTVYCVCYAVWSRCSLFHVCVFDCTCICASASVVDWRVSI